LATRASDQSIGFLLSALIVFFANELLDWNPGSPRQAKRVSQETHFVPLINARF
jgi:hypothetical protein